MAEAEKYNKVILTEIIEKLPEGVTAMVGEYSGSGDSGNFDSIELNNQHEDFDGTDEKQAKTKTFAMPDGLEDRIIDLMYGLLEAKHPGWENNEGASGTVTIITRTRRVVIEHTEYYTESSTDTEDFKL